LILKSRWSNWNRKFASCEDYSTDSVDFSSEIKKLEKKADKLREEIFTNLTRWQRTQLARHQNRPYTLDYVKHVFTDWFEVHGDRNFRDDPALVCGLARFDGEPCWSSATRRGGTPRRRSTATSACPTPKATARLCGSCRWPSSSAADLHLCRHPRCAFPGIGAEERGQAEAIARNLREMAALTVPIIVTVTGEGGSGGALAIAVGNRVLMMQYSVYAVISPEGCAAILWSDGSRGPQAAEALKLTAQDIAELGDVIDEVITEPPGGAHNDHVAAAAQVKKVLKRHLAELRKLSGEELVEQRYRKFRAMSRVEEPQ
jgi:acetyl-CoA carboxylase carboxyl transferase subunit alpha